MVSGLASLGRIEAVLARLEQASLLGRLREAADTETPVDTLITRVRYMSESIAAKRAQR